MKKVGKRSFIISLVFALVLSMCTVPFPMQNVKAATIVSRVVVSSDGKGYLEVDGKPFNASYIQNCGGQQLYCGSEGVPLYDPPYPVSWLENVFEKTAALGYNTISIALKWNEIEPTTQGGFDWTLIDNYISWANEYGLRIDFAWFGANNCGGTRLPGYSESGWASQVPVYLQNHDKYWGNGWNRLDSTTENNIFHCPWLPGDGNGHDTDANYVMQCERNAVANLFSHLATADTNHRTILFQVWNEPNCHYTWPTTSTIQMGLMNQLAGVVKSSDYIVATRVNMAAGVSADFTSYTNIDMVGTDTYNTSVSYNTGKLDLLASDGSKLPYIGENWANLDNTSSIAVACLADGGFYNVWSLNSHWWDSGMYDASGDNAVENWELGTIPEKRHSGIDMTNLNMAMNKIGSKIAVAPKTRIAGFNIENNNPGANYNSFKEVGGYDIGFSTSNASVGMAVVDGNFIYAVSDTGIGYSNMALGKSATMNTTAYAGHPASYTTDGDSGTFTQSDSDVPWDLTVDLGSTQTINRVVFKPDSSNYASQYTVKVSTDNTNWTTVATETSGTGTGKTYDFSITSTRYVKIDVTAEVGGGSTWGHAVKELEVYNTNNPVPQVYYKTKLEPVSITKGHLDANGNWVSEGNVSYTDNGDGTYSIKYDTQVCLRIVMPANLALTGTAAMNTDSYTGHQASQANDGKSNTFAQSNSDTPWDLTLDLGSMQTINTVVFEPDSSNYASQYTVKVSTDNSNWTTVATETNGTGTSRKYNFADTAARYVKIDVTTEVGGGASWGHAIREVKIYGLLNLSLGKTATMDTGSYTGHPASHANDGDDNTYAQSNSDVPWDLTIDLGNAQTINRIVFRPDSSNYASQYTLKVSTDNSNWTTVATETSGTGTVKTYDFAGTSARYVKIDVTAEVGGGTSWGHAVREVKVYAIMTY